MLLSIDRVLQLLAEGKTIQKIAELAGVETEDVVRVVEEARRLIDSMDKSRSRKKIIIRKKSPDESAENAPDERGDDDTREIFEGAELSAVPLGSSLIVHVDGASRGNPGPAGIGIVINDSDNRQVGKVSAYIGEQTNNFAEYTALIRALKIAIYFKTRSLKIRTDSELVAKQIKGEYRVNNENIRPLYNEAMRLKKMISNCRIEYVSRTFNDKADYLAKKAAETAR
jgi:ribonuclease HI